MLPGPVESSCARVWAQGAVSSLEFPIRHQWFPNWPPKRAPGLWANVSIHQPEGGPLENGSCGEGRCKRKKLFKIPRALSCSESEHQGGRQTKLLEKGALNIYWICQTFPDTLRKTREGHSLGFSTKIFSILQITGMWALRRAVWPLLLHIGIKTHWPFNLLGFSRLVLGQDQKLPWKNSLGRCHF